MPRVPQIQNRSEVADSAAHHVDAIVRGRGQISGPFAVLLNSPEVAGRAAHLGSYLRFESSLDAVTRELVVLTTAREFDCQYEWSAHVVIGRQAGVREQAIAAIARRQPLDGLTAGERLVIQYARELLRTKRVSDDTFAAARERFGVQGVTELTATIGYYGMLACALNAFQVEPDGAAERLP